MSYVYEHQQLLYRIRAALMVVMIGLVGSGLTTFPVVWEVGLLNQWFGGTSVFSNYAPDIAKFVSHIHEGVIYTDNHYPFLFYGLDWLGFAHIAIALVFVGVLRDPVRNQWVIEWAVMICLLVVPAIFAFGVARSMPIFWSFVDGMFPLMALIPLCLAWYWTRAMSVLSVSE